MVLRSVKNFRHLGETCCPFFKVGDSFNFLSTPLNGTSVSNKISGVPESTEGSLDDVEDIKSLDVK